MGEGQRGWVEVQGLRLDGPAGDHGTFSQGSGEVHSLPSDKSC